MDLTSYEQWQAWSAEYSVLPYVQKYELRPGEAKPASWESLWEQSGAGAFVLESGKDGRYTFIGLRPASAIRGAGDTATVVHPDGRKESWQGKPLALVKRWMSPFRAPRLERLPKFMGGCVGFWGYEVVRSIERLPEQADADLGVPDYAFVQIDELWAIDHERNELYCSVMTHWPADVRPEAELQERYRQAVRRAERLKRQWDELQRQASSEAALAGMKEKLAQVAEDVQQIDVHAIEGLQADFPRERFIAAVRRIQDYIGAGDVFQVNLSVRQHKRLTASADHIYEWLRRVNPSPYMGYLRFDDFQLVSGSPELLVQLENGIVRTRPIAGTRPRGATPEEDKRLEEELLSNEKERAEHIMLVDLERNDLGRISTFGSVQVRDLMVIERYSHVMHIVSEVTGRLAEGNDAYDVIAATFPGGTITGAPKIRTMQIIEELEPVRRGPYTGSIGWMDYNGNMEFNIVIRTLVVKEGIGYVQAGAGIVIDSVPEKEYTEALNKAKAMWKSILYSERSSCATGGNAR